MNVWMLEECDNTQTLVIFRHMNLQLQWPKKVFVLSSRTRRSQTVAGTLTLSMLTGRRQFLFFEVLKNILQNNKEVCSRQWATRQARHSI